jgi:predicted nuclease with RNAse H fold
MFVAGIDVSERRGQTVALLESASRSVEVQTVRRGDRAAEVAAVLDVLAERRAAVVGVDAPLQPSRMLLRDEETRRTFGVPARRGMNGPVYANYRVCDSELIRRGMPLYQVPDSYERAAGWMRAGFDLARALTEAGYRQPRHDHDHGATLLEVFPDAAFVTLLGGRPARKSGADGARGRLQRRSVLEAEGIRPDALLSHDALDAVAAALTALRWHEGRGCAVGHPDEGLIVLPVPLERLLDRYRPLPERAAEARPTALMHGDG